MEIIFAAVEGLICLLFLPASSEVSCNALGGADNRRESMGEGKGQSKRGQNANATPPVSRHSLPAVGIVGLGYVGLPLAVAFAEVGCQVIGVESDPRKVQELAGGRSYIEDVSSAKLEEISPRFHVSATYEPLANAD